MQTAADKPQTVVVTARCPFAWIDGMSRLNRTAHIERALACLVVIIGAYGQVHDSMVPPASPWSNSHLGFGAVLFASVAIRQLAWIRIRRKSDPPDLFAATRRTARLIYILLYSLAGLRELTNIACYRWHGGAVGAEAPAMESFQIYLGYGAAALVALRFGNGSLRR